MGICFPSPFTLLYRHRWMQKCQACSRNPEARGEDAGVCVWQWHHQRKFCLWQVSRVTCCQCRNLLVRHYDAESYNRDADISAWRMRIMRNRLRMWMMGQTAKRALASSTYPTCATAIRLECSFLVANMHAATRAVFEFLFCALLFCKWQFASGSECFTSEGAVTFCA